MNEFHILQRGISEIQLNASSDDSYEQGYQILRQCRAEGQAVLAADYVAEPLHVPSAPGEKEKRQLQRCGAILLSQDKGLRCSCRVLIDASARRFQAKKIYLRALAAMRWVNGRYAVLQGQKPHQGHTAALQRLDLTLGTVSRIVFGQERELLTRHSQELAAVTNERVFNDLRRVDQQAGYYLQDDPSLQRILSSISSQ